MIVSIPWPLTFFFFFFYQRGDPPSSKELATVTLTRIYVAIQPYQTLVREISTQTIPSFATACIQLLKVNSGVPASVRETICEAFTTLIPLHPATFRPCSSQARTAVRPYLAPTQSDDTCVSKSLSQAARKLTIALHFVAAKSSGSDEWLKLLDGVLRDLHQTTDQVFRAIDESWQATSGYSRSNVPLDGEPHGGDATAPEQLPAWTGITAGSQRLAGLFAYLEETLRCATKSAVTIPLGAYMDAICRICVIVRLSPKTQTWDQAVDTVAGIGRDEKDELWSIIPNLHIAAIKLLLTLLQRLDKDMVPLVPESLDHLVRIFKSGASLHQVRATSYQVLDEILAIAGTTMSKTTVDTFDPIMISTCSDLQQDIGFLKPKPVEKADSSGKSSKKNGVTNADLFLQNPQSSASSESAIHLDPVHKAAAVSLTASLLSNVPQTHLKLATRGLLDRTAILTGDREAMLASVLNPFKDRRGHVLPSILPYMCRRFPDDRGLEILRSNLRTSSINGSADMFASIDYVAEEEHDVDDDDDEMQTDEKQQQKEEDVSIANAPVSGIDTLSSLPNREIKVPTQESPFATRQGNHIPAPNPFVATADAASPPKRKHDGQDSIPAKRLEVEKPAVLPEAKPVAAAEEAEKEEDDDDDSDVSVHLNMELEDDDEE